MRAALALMAVVLGCAKPAWQLREVPPPGVSMPTGLIVVSVDAGDARDAAIVVESIGYVPRRNPITTSGVYALRLTPGEWQVYVEGLPGKTAAPIRFGDTTSESAKTSADKRRWPESPLTVEVKRNKLTNAGQLCLHAACSSEWSPFDHPRFAEWESEGRYVEGIGPDVPSGVPGDSLPPPAEK